MQNEHKLAERMPSGRLFAYDGRVSIEEHLAGLCSPKSITNNLIPIAGRVHLLTLSPANIDTLAIGDNGSARSLADEDLKNKLFTAAPTDSRIVGTKKIMELFVGINEANFIHREFGAFAGGTLISTLIIAPEFEKTTAKTRTYIWEMGWF